MTKIFKSPNPTYTMDLEMNQEQQLIAPSGLPETIKYNESVRMKLNKRHDKEFVRREESKLHELIASLSEEEIARLEEELILVPTFQPNTHAGG